eukprot:9886408-Alexandrium_andersonii.AAC.1
MASMMCSASRSGVAYACNRPDQMSCTTNTSRAPCLPAMKSDLDAMKSHVRCAPKQVASDTNEPL